MANIEYVGYGVAAPPMMVISMIQHVWPCHFHWQNKFHQPTGSSGLSGRPHGAYGRRTSQNMATRTRSATQAAHTHPQHSTGNAQSTHRHATQHTTTPHTRMSSHIVLWRLWKPAGNLVCVSSVESSAQKTLIVYTQIAYSQPDATSMCKFVQSVQSGLQSYVFSCNPCNPCI